MIHSCVTWLTYMWHTHISVWVICVCLLWHDSFIQPIADWVAQNLEIISNFFQFSTRRTRILMGFISSIIYYVVLIANPIGRVVVRLKSSGKNFEILCHPICNWLYVAYTSRSNERNMPSWGVIKGLLAHTNQWMSHGINKRVMAHLTVNWAKHSHINVWAMAHMNESWHTSRWRERNIHISMHESWHVWMSHGTYEWVMAHMNESWRIWMSHGTYEWVMAHMKESWHTSRWRERNMPSGDVITGPTGRRTPFSWTLFFFFLEFYSYACEIFFAG